MRGPATKSLELGRRVIPLMEGPDKLGLVESLATVMEDPAAPADIRLLASVRFGLAVNAQVRLAVKGLGLKNENSASANKSAEQEND